jgi:acyl-CoA thioesterase-1
MKKNSSGFRVHGSELKGTILLIFSCLLLVTIFIGCAKQEIKNLGSKGKTIVCFGDSITFGYGVVPGEDYPAQLSRLLNTPIINAGLDGDTSTTALARIEADVLAKDPFLAIVEFTGNDFIKRVPIEETEKNIAVIVDRIQSRGIIVAIADVSAGMFLAEYRSLLAKIAREKRAIFIPELLSGIITTPSLKSDFIHPNAAGYKLIAQRVLRVISPYLKQNLNSTQAAR